MNNKNIFKKNMSNIFINENDKYIYIYKWTIDYIIT